MGRPVRILPARVVFHVFNRAIEDKTLFETRADYAAFERVLETAVRLHRVDLYDYVVMPNHWHLQCAGRVSGEITAFTKWLSETHAARWRTSRRSRGRGRVYQGRFKAVPVQSDEHFVVLATYIARNPVRASLVDRADEWAWSGYARRCQRDGARTRLLSTWPVARPQNWAEIVARPLGEDRVAAIRESLRVQLPFGSDSWTEQYARRCGLAGRLRLWRRRRARAIAS